MNDRQSILRKIERLLAIVRGGSGPEAETALMHARRLMAKHQVTEEQVGQRERWSEREVWRGCRRPTSFDFALALVSEFFWCRAIFGRGVEDAPPWRLYQTLVLFGDAANLAVGEYAFTFFLREFESAIRAAKPRQKRSFALGLYGSVRGRLQADERGWAVRAETTEIALSPRRLQERLDAAYDARTEGLSVRPERKQPEPSRIDALRGMEAGQAIDFRRPLANPAVAPAMALEDRS